MSLLRQPKILKTHLLDVYFLPSAKVLDNRINIESISTRPMVVELVINPKTTIIFAYSLTNESSEDETNQFYTDFRLITEKGPLHNLLIIAGDCQFFT